MSRVPVGIILGVDEDSFEWLPLGQGRTIAFSLRAGGPTGMGGPRANQMDHAIIAPSPSITILTQRGLSSRSREAWIPLFPQLFILSMCPPSCSRYSPSSGATAALLEQYAFGARQLL